VIYSHEYISRKEFIDIFLLGRELSKSEELLSNLLPSRRHAKQLLQGELVCDDHQDVTLLYSDVKGFTPLAAKLHPLKLCKLLNKIYSAFDDYLSPFGLYKVDTIGDAFVVVGGLSAATPSQSQHGQDQTDHATNSVFFAFYMLECLRRIREVPLLAVPTMSYLPPPEIRRGSPHEDRDPYWTLHRGGGQREQAEISRLGTDIHHSELYGVIWGPRLCPHLSVSTPPPLSLPPSDRCGLGKLTIGSTPHR
jgi:hypothetical protein